MPWRSPATKISHMVQLAIRCQPRVPGLRRGARRVARAGGEHPPGRGAARDHPRLASHAGVAVRDRVAGRARAGRRGAPPRPRPPRRRAEGHATARPTADVAGPYPARRATAGQLVARSLERSGTVTTAPQRNRGADRSLSHRANRCATRDPQGAGHDSARPSPSQRSDLRAAQGAAAVTRCGSAGTDRKWSSSSSRRPLEPRAVAGHVHGGPRDEPESVAQWLGNDDASYRVDRGLHW